MWPKLSQKNCNCATISNPSRAPKTQSETLKTPQLKCTRLIGILATWSCLLWPGDDDDKEEDDVCHLVVAALLLDLANLTKLSENIVHTQQRWALCIGSCYYYYHYYFGFDTCQFVEGLSFGFRNFGLGKKVSVSKILVSENILGFGFRKFCHRKSLGFKKFGLRKKVWVSEILISAKSFGFVFGSFGIENKKTEWQEDDQNKIKDKEIIVCCWQWYWSLNLRASIIKNKTLPSQ